jgi:hypothetical protein
MDKVNADRTMNRSNSAIYDFLKNVDPAAYSLAPLHTIRMAGIKQAANI